MEDPRLQTPAQPGRGRARPLQVAVPAFAALALLVVLAPGGAAAQDAPPELPRPCEGDPARSELDFWLGEWRVEGSEGQVLGHNRITKRHGGCVVEEVWTSARGGGSGESLNFVDPSDGRWRQVWVGSSGTVIRYEGELRDGAMHYRGSAVTADGSEAHSRMVLEPLEGGRVRQRIDRSDDGGTTWRTTFEGTYLPAAAAPSTAGAPAPVPPPSAPPAPAPSEPASRVPEPPAAAPAPEPPPEATAPEAEPEGSAGQVVAVSAAASDEDLPPEDRPKTRLRSPMVLELPVGPVEALPRGYSWSTAETARYVSEGASVRKVTVTRKGSDLEVTVALHGEQYLQHAALTVELLAGGEAVAAAELPGFPLGRSLLAQNRGDGVEKRMVLELGRETFERVFSADERPVLRLVLTARD